ncbi:hypothetical protein H5T58_00990, partial [Candidatus Parcubacteria bacterium]|nr:hypothetical protein [Candidatus Parcubacteria bacterium]
METKLIIFDLFGTLIFPNPKVKKEDFFVFYKSLGIKIESQKDFEKFSKIFTKAMKSSSSWQELSQKVIE